MNIIKASGEIVEFNSNKLKLSLERSGASPTEIEEILTAVHNNLYENIGTKEIYQKAYDLLNKKSSIAAVKYKLKKAIMELGPTGYPFEQLIAKLLQYQGYNTEVGVIINGKCISHEIDVIANRKDQYIMVECKFHNKPGTKSDVKVPLYINSRFWAVKNSNNFNGRGVSFDFGWVVTNTRFSEDAIKYGSCAGLKLVSWDYPKKGNLREWIEVSGFHPITCLENLKRVEIEFLLDNNIVLARELNDQITILEGLHIEPKRLSSLVHELKQIVNI